jgi:hypothetical protein
MPCGSSSPVPPAASARPWPATMRRGATLGWSGGAGRPRALARQPARRARGVSPRRGRHRPLAEAAADFMGVSGCPTW